MEYIEDPSLTSISPRVRDTLAEDNALLEAAPIQYPELNASHITHSHRTIEEAAEYARSTTSSTTESSAIVLGPGNSVDIPLAGITERFDRVTLVDIAPGSVIGAVQRFVNPDHHDRIRIIGADISGTVAHLGHLTDITASPEVSSEEIYRELPDALDAIATASLPPNLGEDYDFVCSHLVMSVALSEPLSNLGEVVGSKIEDTEGPYSSMAEDLRQAIRRLNASTQVAHVGLLRQLVAPGGIVHLGDTFTYTYADEEADPVAMVNKSSILGAMREGFTIDDRRSWLWVQDPGTYYDVHTFRLSPQQPSLAAE